MTEEKTGGPAFPVHGGNADDDPRNRILSGGMTLRDWFAGQALVGLLADGGASTWEGDAANAYKVADAMMDARK
jgi:hypothetical protein